MLVSDNVRAAEANSMSSAPLVFRSSCWNRNSAATFLLRRRKRESISGDWPRTDAYISDLVIVSGIFASKGRRTDDHPSDVADHLAKAWISRMLDEQS